ncbi:flagellar basal body P-ring formation chaperone FlgA [Rhizobium helianthi]|uniref:Flagella basal body P-ring formation protein FlgA n=1 Tax=Rhizobium helianthi TaxID=1132695 RepID=A0ABW4M0P7_9HYPH
MMFRRNSRMRSAIGGLALGVICLAGSQASAQNGMAVVPKQTIYPGQEIDAAQLQEVEVTNPNIAGGYANSISQVAGMISSRTLLPGRTIQLNSLREPYAVKRGTTVRMTFAVGNMVIAASGTPLENAAVGDVIRLRNLDSGITVSGTVMADGSVQVMAR